MALPLRPSSPRSASPSRTAARPPAHRARRTSYAPLAAASLCAALVFGCGPAGPAELSADEVAADLAQAAQFLKDDRPKDAERMFMKILKRDPEHLEAQAGMAAVRLDERNLDDAIALYERVLAKQADRATWHFGLGEAKRMKGDHAGAAAAYGKAFELDGENAAYGLAYGSELNAAEQFAAAEPVLKQVAELDAQIMYVYTALGDAQRGQDKLDEALRTYMKAQSTYRGDQKAYAGAAFVYEAKGEISKALDQWSEYIRQDCCSDFSKDVARKKVETLKITQADPETVDDISGLGQGGDEPE